MLKHLEGILFYAVFFADFGDREHVFMPVRPFCAAAWESKSSLIDYLASIVKPRRWLRRQQDAFFTITPEERKLVEATTDNSRGTSAGDVVVPSDS